jgi:diguanylate cyclase (GGDEF)-like protein
MINNHHITRFSLVVNQQLDILRVSPELDAFKTELISSNMAYLANVVYDIKNQTRLEGLLEKLEVLVSKTDSFDHRFYSFELTDSVYVSFELLLIPMLNKNNKEVNVTFKDVMFEDNLSTVYNHLFDAFDDAFDPLSLTIPMGRFIINPQLGMNRVYGSASIPKLFSISPEPSHEYRLYQPGSKDYKSNMLVFSESYFIQISLLLNHEIDVLKVEMKVKDKWLQMQCRLFKLHNDSDVTVIGGFVRDITEFRAIEDIEYVQSIYEMAITSGGIGIFHYDLDKHPANYFEANDIYANMIGIEPDSEGLYALSDFMSTLLPLEEEITDNEEVLVSLNKLLEGQLDGTIDDILKIKNHKTDEILYLLSSSKIDQRFPNGKPKRFGGTVIDITERIEKEKFQREYAYKDELTGLGNNRRLHYDMKKRDNGIGLFFDLDNFKKINDRFGHLMGDRMLKLYAKALMNAAVDVEDVYIYRLYGDEFFVFAEHQDISFALDYEKKVISYITHSKAKKDGIKLDASMGVALYDTKDDIDDFIKSADYEMYKTKIKKKSKR